MSALADVVVPQNEEGTRATVLRWCKRVGDSVAKDEPLVELETDKVTVEVPAPSDGALAEILKPENAEVNPGDVLARLRPATDQLGSAVAIAGQPRLTGDPAVTREPAVMGEWAAIHADATKTSASRGAEAMLSPSVRRLLQEHALTPAVVAGTGRDGRITAQDVLRHVKTQAPEGAQRVPHSAIRKRVAEHMLRSLSDAPHVTTLFEADLTRVMAHRRQHAADFASRGVRLTLTAYFVNACAQALMQHREVNATFHADALELHADANIGVGTALGSQGLIVPVIHKAQTLDLFGVAKRLGEVVEGARGGKLATADVRGGTFTLSNHGVGGSLLAAPIVINQPQVAILGVGKVERRVCVVETDGAEAIAVRSMCYVTLTIDHRALDAFQANAFLSAVVERLNHWPD